MALPTLLLLLALAPAQAQESKPTEKQAEEVPPGVEQILPRGGIPAIFEPKFVAAEQAGMPEGAWIFGVVVGEEARAYSLNLLNHHEIVNDTVGGQPIAAVW